MNVIPSAEVLNTNTQSGFYSVKKDNALKHVGFETKMKSASNRFSRGLSSG